MAKRKTNIQIVKSIMEHSNYGALAQAFVIEAISRYAQECSVINPKDYNENSFINMEAWKGCAIEIQEKLDLEYRFKAKQV